MTISTSPVQPDPRPCRSPFARRQLAVVVPVLGAVSLVAAACSNAGPARGSSTVPNPTTTQVTAVATTTDSPATPGTPSALLQRVSWPGKAPNMTPVDAATAAEWQAKAQAALAGHDGLNGLWLAYSDPQKGYWSSALGKAVTSPATPAALDDYARIGSITKTFTATAILEQVAAGKLSLDDTVANVIPATAAQFPATAARTVRELLSMSSGLPDYGNSPGTIVAQTIKDPTRVWTPQQLIANALETPVSPAGTPGYNTTNYVLLGLMLERLTGQTVNEVVNGVAHQAGLAHTVLPPADDTALPAPASHGYVDTGFVEDPAVLGTGLTAGTDVANWSESWGGAGGAMYSTVGDIFKWAATGMGTAFLPAELAAQRLDTKIPALADKGYGLGIEQPAVGWIGHGGQTLGWTTFAAYNPQTGATIAAIANSPTGIAAAQLLWLNISRPEPQTALQLSGGAVPPLG